MEKYGDTLFTLDDTERRRLVLLGDVFDPLSTTTLSGLGLRPDARVLEVGAGGGSIARWFADQVPAGEVVATDLDISMAARETRPNLRVLTHDVTVDPFPANSFDVIHSRFLLSHLRDRESVIARMTDWLRPGGVVVIESFGWFPIDSSSDAPYRHVMQRWSDLILDTIGTDTRWSREYPRTLARFGLKSLGATTVTHHIQGGSPLADFWRLTVAMSRDKMLDGGYITAAEYDAFAERLLDPSFWDLAPAVAQTWGRK